MPPPRHALALTHTHQAQLKRGLLLNMSNMQREVKQADALDKLRLCVTCGQACVRRPGTNWRMQGCANHTRAHCCGAVHDGDCRADLKSLSGKQLFEQGWLCPLCAPLPTEPARLALRLHDVKRQYRMLAARHVKLGMTAKGFAAARADMHGDKQAHGDKRRRAAWDSSDSDSESESDDTESPAAPPPARYTRRPPHRIAPAASPPCDGPLGVASGIKTRSSCANAKTAE